MKIQIRKSVFETNSSSVHALIYSHKTVENLDIELDLSDAHTDFGWGEKIYTRPEEKFIYLTVLMVKYYEGYNSTEGFKESYSNLVNILKNKYNVKLKREYYKDPEFVIDLIDKWDWYIDHSDIKAGDIFTYISNVETLAQIIVNDSCIITSNDNGSYDFFNGSIEQKTKDLNSFEVFIGGN